MQTNPYAATNATNQANYAANKKALEAQMAGERAEIELAGVEDTIASNQQQSQATAGLAFANARQGRPVGGGSYRRARSASTPNSAISGLGAANATALKDARLKTLSVKQKPMQDVIDRGALQYGNIGGTVRGYYANGNKTTLA